MKTTYAVALPQVLRYEGGYVNHPKDPGGATNKGVTQATYDRWRRDQGLARRDVLEIRDAEVAAIYRGGYWDAVAGDRLPAGPDFASFDGAVNSGPARGAKWLQKAVGAAQDGRVGDRTVDAAWAASDHAATVKVMCKARLSFLTGLKTWSTFGKGWRSRVAQVEAFGVSLAMKAAGATATEIQAEATAEAKRAETKAKAQDGAAATAGASSTAPASQVDPGQVVDPASADQLVANIVMGGLFLALLVVVAVLVWRGRVNRARARAYAQEAAAAAKGKQP